MTSTQNSNHRHWTVYLCQDKHLDYNWCGSNTEIEIRMTELLDFYLEQAETRGSRWNLDGTLWFDVYRRHRGETGAARLLDAIRNGYFGFGANHSVQLWGMMSTESAFRALSGGRQIEDASGIPAKTALIMETWGILHGAGTILTESGVSRLARGTYPLRAEEFHRDRAPYPLFYWTAPNGRKILVYWPTYTDTKSWGGYAEAFELATIAGETWDALEVHEFGDRNSPSVFEKRCEFIRNTAKRHEAHGADYPVSSIMLLGTGWDNWTKTDDYAVFIDRFNNEGDSSIRIVDARYDQYFDAVETEIKEKGLLLPILEGSFGIAWEEWPAHLAGFTTDFREAERLLRIGEAKQALSDSSSEPNARGELIDAGYDAVMRFLEHDMGGSREYLASVSAGVRAAASTQALDIGITLAGSPPPATPRHSGVLLAEAGQIVWRGGLIRFTPDRFGVSSIVTANGNELLPQSEQSSTDALDQPLLGEPLVTRFDDEAQMKSIFPPVLPHPRTGNVERKDCRKNAEGTSVLIDGTVWGYTISVHWLFYEDSPWIDITYRLEEGWDEHAQTFQICFPAAIDTPVYRYDTAGAILKAGLRANGGDDLPGANPELFATQTFIAANGVKAGGSHARNMLIITPDAYLFQRGGGSIRATGYDASELSCQIVSMPMMNLTRQDLQFRQGGRRSWKFRYRIVFDDGPWNPANAIALVQHFATPPFLWTPGSGASVPEIEQLDIEFPGGPLIAAKPGIDGESLVLRFWNVLDRKVSGSVRLPDAYDGGEICDALERSIGNIYRSENRLSFNAHPRSIVTICLTKGGARL
jgi:hypothetical protein